MGKGKRKGKGKGKGDSRKRVVAESDPYGGAMNKPKKCVCPPLCIQCHNVTFVLLGLARSCAFYVVVMTTLLLSAPSSLLAIDKVFSYAALVTHSIVLSRCGVRLLTLISVVTVSLVWPKCLQ